MTRKDYELIAKALRATRDRVDSENDGKEGAHRDQQLRGVRRAAAHLATALESDNPRFDVQRFLTACGYGA